MSAVRTDELGQLLFIGVKEDRWSPALENWLRAERPGGVILSPRNLRTPEYTAELLANLARTLDPPPFLAIDDAVDGVDLLLKLFPALPSLHVVATKGPLSAGKLGDLAGAGLQLLGFNTIFAPLLDLATESHEVRARSKVLSANTKLITICADAFVKGLQEHNVFACPKYFPGFGDLRTDPDSGIEISGKSMARIWSEDLVPYHKLLPRVQLVLVSHRGYKAYDSDHVIPASISANVLEGLLRVKLGYGGLALANFSRLLEDMPVKVELILQSIAAGCDMVMVGPGGSANEVTVESLRVAVDAGKLSAKRIDEALKRIGRAKKGLRRRTREFSQKTFNRLRREFEDFNKECQTAE